MCLLQPLSGTPRDGEIIWGECRRSPVPPSSGGVQAGSALVYSVGWPQMAASTAWFISVQINYPVPPSRVAFVLLTGTVPDLCCPLNSCLDSQTGMGQIIWVVGLSHASPDSFCVLVWTNSECLTGCLQL